MTTIGRLRQRVTIEAPQRTSDGAGGVYYSWTTLATVAADVSSFKGSELYNADRLEPSEPFRVIIRYRPDVRHDMRLRWRGRVLDIEGVSDSEGTRRWLTLDCRGRGE